MSRALLAASVGLLAAGCGNPPSKPAPKTESDGTAIVPKVLVTEPVVEVFSPDGKSSYLMRGKQSTIILDDKGAQNGAMDSVTGEIKKEGKVVCTFRADKGRIDKEKQTLTLTGHPRVTSQVEVKGSGRSDVQSQDVVLEANLVTYDQGQARYVAEGSVTVTSGGARLGPVKKLLANKELTKIATPGKFK